MQGWVDANRPLAEQGKIKWSDYYTEMYDRSNKITFPNKGATLERIATMIQVSKEYESGRISKDQFDHATRLAQAGQAKDDEAQDAAARQRMAAALQNTADGYKRSAENYQRAAQQPVPTYTPPQQINCTTYGNQTNCSTR